MTRPSLKNPIFYTCLALVLGATGLWIYGGVAIFDWVEVAEMMPYQKVVDTLAGQDLHSTVYFIRQNFQIHTGNPPRIHPRNTRNRRGADWFRHLIVFGFTRLASAVRSHTLAWNRRFFPV
jgi:hypothetical protein